MTSSSLNAILLQPQIKALEAYIKAINPPEIREICHLSVDSEHATGHVCFKRLKQKGAESHISFHAAYPNQQGGLTAKNIKYNMYNEEAKKFEETLDQALGCGQALCTKVKSPDGNDITYSFNLSDPLLSQKLGVHVEPASDAERQPDAWNKLKNFFAQPESNLHPYTPEEASKLLSLMTDALGVEASIKVKGGKLPGRRIE